MRLSTAPVIGPQGLRPVPFALRVFVAAVRRRLRRDARRTGASLPAARRTGLRLRAVRRRQGHVGPVGRLVAQPAGPGARAPGAVELRRTGRELPSRTADNLFWLGRYVERAEAIMRQVRASVLRLIDDDRPSEDLLADRPRAAPDASRRPTSRHRTTPSGLPASAPAWSASSASWCSMPDRDYGLRRTLRDLGRTASLSRDRLSGRLLAHPAAACSRTSSRAARGSPSRRDARRSPVSWRQLDQGIQRLAAFSGMGMENMTRSFGWRFLDMGRRVERSIQMTALLGSLLAARGPGGRRQPDPRARHRRQLHDLPLALPAHAAAGAGARPAAARRDQPALGGLPARRRWRAPRAAAALRRRAGGRHVQAAGARRCSRELRLADIDGLCRRSRLGDRPGLEALLGSVAEDLCRLTHGASRAPTSAMRTTVVPCRRPAIGSR